jgi:hypothetical protein
MSDTLEVVEIVIGIGIVWVAALGLGYYLYHKYITRDW